MIFTDHLGHSVDVDLPSVEPELRNLIHAADEACGISSTAAELERLRHARRKFMDAIAKTERRAPATT